MAKPSKHISWLVGNPDIANRRTEPTADLTFDGYELNSEPSSKNMNWLLSFLDQWDRWAEERLDAITDESGNLTSAGTLTVTGLGTIGGNLDVTGAISSGGVSIPTASSTTNFTNKSFQDSTTEFYDNSDSTKRFKFQASGITAGQTRTFTFPDADGTLLAGTVPIASGGSGQTTANAALNAFLPSQAGNGGKILATDGTDAVWTSALTSTLTDSYIFVGNGSNVATAVPLSGDISISNTGAAAIVAGVIVDADINASAAIAYSKLAPMSTGQILLGNAGTPTATTLSGDVTVGANGVTAIASGVIVDADVNASAAIAGTKVSPAFGSQNISTTGTFACGVPALGIAGVNTAHTHNTGRVVIRSAATSDLTYLDIRSSTDFNGAVGVNGTGGTKLIAGSADKALCLGGAGGISFSGDGTVTQHATISTAGAVALGKTGFTGTHQVNAGVMQQTGGNTTSAVYGYYRNSDNSKGAYFGINNSAGTALITSTDPGAGVVLANNGLAFSGNASTNHMSISTAGAVTLGAIHNIGAGNITSGTYTPTLTNGTNVSASTATLHTYTRVGNVVTVAGNLSSVTATAGANTQSIVEVSLPIASNFTSDPDCNGAGCRLSPSGTANGVAWIAANAVADRAIIYFNAPSSGAAQLNYTFQYVVK